MKSKRRFIPLVFLGAIILSLLVIVPAFSATGSVRFHVIGDEDEDQEWTRQGGMIGIEVEDSDLDVVAKFEGSNAESIVLQNKADFELSSVPVADRCCVQGEQTPDGFVNRRDITVVDENGNTLDVKQAGADGLVELQEAHTGTVMVSYWGAVVNDTGMGDDSTVLVRSQADPSGIQIYLTETSANSGVFRGEVMTTDGDSDEAAMTLKVGANDVIRVTYSDADPDRNTSQTLKVETTAPIISNPSPAHGTADRADPDIEFDVTDSDSGIANADDIYVVFGVDNDPADGDGEIDATYRYMVNDAPKGDVDEEDDVFSAKQGLPSEVDIDNDATVYWWAIAMDSAGNVAVSDRQSTIDDESDPCNAGDFNMGNGLTGKNVGISAEIAGCQPYAVRIDNTEPELEAVTTGYTWDSDDDEPNTGAGDANSIMLTFSEILDPTTVDDNDFDVEGASVTDVEVRGDTDTNMGYVFLSLSSALAPDEEPEVELVGSVRDIAGNRQTSGTVGATDGIAPTLTVAVEGGNRSVTNGSVTVTIMSNEDVGTPSVRFQKVIDADAADNDDTDANEAMYALDTGDQVDGVLTSERNYEAKFTADSSGLYNVYVTARDATESNQGSAGVNEGPIDLSDDTSAILFEFDDAVGKPTVSPTETDNADAFISIDFAAEGVEYMDDAEKDLDSHGTVTITAATLKSPNMDAMDIADMLVTTDNVKFLYRASDLAKGDHVVTVSAMDAAGNELEDEELKVTVEEREPFSLGLIPGWNLVSLPGTPTNTSLNAVIPADHPASTILTYDATDGWMTAIRSDDGMWLGTLTHIDATRAYWIQTDSFESLSVDIPRISAGTSVLPTISLMAGWNFVPVTDVSGELNDGDPVSASDYFSGADVNRVYTFDTLSGMWETVDVADGHLMVGSGYWVHADSDDVLAP